MGQVIVTQGKRGIKELLGQIRLKTGTDYGGWCALWAAEKSVPCLRVWLALMWWAMSWSIFQFKIPKSRSMQIGTPAVAKHLLNNPDAYLTPVGSFIPLTN